MIELQSHRVLQAAGGGTRGEALLATNDGRILVAQTSHIDEISPLHPPHVLAATVPDGALIPLPMNEMAISFDQAMWIDADGADATDPSSVLNPANYLLIASDAGSGNAGSLAPYAGRLNPSAVRWNAATRSVVLSLPQLAPGGWRLEVSNAIRSAAQVPLEQSYVTSFTTLLDFSYLVKLDFSNTRGNHATGAVSYDVSITNTGTEDIRGPLTLLLDPGRYFGAQVEGGMQGGGEQSDLWSIDLTAALAAQGGKIGAGATLAGQTVTVIPASLFGSTPSSGQLVKFNLGHGIYAAPYQNTPPSIGLPGEVDPEASDNFLPAATAGQPWTAQLLAHDTDGAQFFWQIVQGPAGLTLTPDTGVDSSADGYSNSATLAWTPSVRDLTPTDILIRVQDKRGGVTLRRFQVDVAGANHAPVISPVYDLTLTEGESLALPIVASDADGNPLTLTLRNLPAGASFDAASGLLKWTPGYDQAGEYREVSIIASDGQATVAQRFNIRVDQGYAKPAFAAIPAQTLREGDAFALQLAGSMPGGLKQADGAAITLEWSAPWLPAGASLNPATGWFAWTPSFGQNGSMNVPVTLTATYAPADGSTPVRTSVTQTLSLTTLYANAAPQFTPADTWHVLEGQPLRVSVFAYDPHNPDFEPKIRLSPLSPAGGGEGTSSVSYQVDGLPPGASFDADTLEIVWTPGYAQAGTYQVSVTATGISALDGSVLTSQLTLPIIVEQVDRPPVIGDIASASVGEGGTLDIPITASDPAGEALTLTVSGLPRFASFTQTTGNGQAGGILHFAPGAGDRGDFTITVTAQNDGRGDPAKALAISKTFVLSATSLSEPPVISMASRAVAVAGQQLRLPILVSDPDQDALTYTAQGLPAGAVIQTDPVYGHAFLVWTPSAAQLGAHDISLSVTDSGLPPQNAGYTLPDDFVAQPNTVVSDLRIVVREFNQAPEVLAVTATGGQAAATATAGAIAITATEGIALVLDVLVRDPDFDPQYWSADGMPPGMSMTNSVGSDGQTTVRLHWTPGMFAAQSSSLGDPAGVFHVTVHASDGVAVASQTLAITVANVNQAPFVLPVPIRLVHEGETLGFTLQNIDPDGDPVQMSLVRDAATPANVYFDARTGYVEWTPDTDAVNNLHAKDGLVTLRFAANDGHAETIESVLVRVLDVNRAPQIQASNHALLVGQDFSIPVIKGQTPSALGIRVSDTDGAAQTQALTVAFDHLPEGARYDAQQQTLHWTPGPGQVGDYVVTARVFDGHDSISQTFTLRVTAEAAANAPQILIDLTPATPLLPGQTVLATVRAESYGAMAQISAHMRNAGAADWSALTLDAAGRVRVTPGTPGLVEMRVSATDVDGFTATTTQTIRVRDQEDSSAPTLTWGGALQSAAQLAAGNTPPVTLTQATLLQARIGEQQLMGWQLQIAPANSAQWTTLAQQTDAATASAGLADLVRLDPALLANGVYQLRLSAWDLSGRTSTIDSRIVIDSSDKTLDQAIVTDAVFDLGGHAFALTRSLATGGEEGADFGNWTLPLQDSHLTHDQPETDAQGALMPWREGARVWLQMPASLAAPQAPMQTLRFTLGTSAAALAAAPAATAGVPSVLHPVFGSSAGWTLQAATLDDNGIINDQPVNLQRQGQRLFDQVTGLPWQPAAWILSGPDGTRYDLDAAGKITGVRFTDGQQWLVSDAGVALTGGEVNDRIDFVRNTTGSIARITGPAGNGSGNSSAQSIAYRYDQQGRLILARPLGSAGAGTQIGYKDGQNGDGSLITDPITANLGAAVNWITTGPNATSNPSNTWSGALASGNAITLSYTVRDSELASSIKTPGAAGAVLLVVTTTGADVQLAAPGATIVGSIRNGDHTTTLLRVTEAGMKLLTLTGSGNASVQLAIAGDLNRDGKIDGSDSAAFEQALTNSDLNGDLDGNGQVTSADRQTLYANYGWRANQAPVALAQSGAPVITTHTDLAASGNPGSVAQDLEGDTLFWRVTGATHGSASIAADGQTLLYTPEAGYAGHATITVQADDGFAAGAPIELGVEVSGAKLLLLHVGRIATLASGSVQRLQVTGDFEDAEGVSLGGNYLQIQSSDASVVRVLDNGAVLGQASGNAIVTVKARGIEGVNVFTVDTSPTEPELDDNGFEVDVYPRAINLPSLVGRRQLKVTLPDHSNISAASAGTRYFISDATVAEISPDGMIHAKASGVAILSIIHGGTQHDVVLRVQQPSTGATPVNAKLGASVQDTDGNMMMVAPGALPANATVSIQSRDLGNLGMPLPAQEQMDALGAVDIAIGGQHTNLPLQLALKVSAPIDPQTGQPKTMDAGTPVYFWRKGTINDAQGVTHDTWWLLDNGVIGEDGIARTSSPPYSGISMDGTILMTSAKVINANTGETRITGSALHADAIWSQSFASMSIGSMMSNAALGIFATLASPAAMHYTIDGSYELQIPQGALEPDKINLEFPASPVGPHDEPDITGLEYDPGTRQLKISGTNFLPPGQSPNNFKLSVWLEPRGNQLAKATEPGVAPERGLVWQAFTPTAVSDSAMQITLPSGVAFSQHVVYVERIALASSGSDQVPVGASVESVPVDAWTDGTNVTLVTTRNTINVFLPGTNGAPAALLKQVTTDAQGKPVEFYGSFTNQIVFSNDGTLAFIAGANGKVYVFDTETQSIVHTLPIEGSGGPITSLLANDGWLYVTEGSLRTPNNGRLLRVNIDQFSEGFLKTRQVLNLGVTTPLGFEGMAVNAGRYLAVTAPMEAIGLMNGGVKKGGNVYVLDLELVDAKGQLGAAALRILNADSYPIPNSGKGPQYITSGFKPGEFLLSNAKDYGKGMAGLRWTVNGDGTLGSTATGVSSKLTPALSDPGWLERKHQENIQRAAGAVMVVYQGKQYALVADYNFDFNDVHFPDQMWGKQIGGKIGIIQDPLGENGAPVFMGATTPIPGAAVNHLSLAADGKLYADAFIDEGGITGSMYNALFVWNAPALIKAALDAQKAGTKLSKPIDRTGPSIASQPIPGTQPTRYNGATAGTYFGAIYGIGTYNPATTLISSEMPPTAAPFEPTKNSLMYQGASSRPGHSFSTIALPSGLTGNVYADGYTITDGKTVTFYPASPVVSLLTLKYFKNSKSLQAEILAPEEYKTLRERLIYLNSLGDPNDPIDQFTNLFSHKLDNPSTRINSIQLAERDALREVQSLYLTNYVSPERYSSFIQKIDNVNSLLGTTAYLGATLAGASQEKRDAAAAIGKLVGNIAFSFSQIAVDGPAYLGNSRPVLFSPELILQGQSLSYKPVLPKRLSQFDLGAELGKGTGYEKNAYVYRWNDNAVVLVRKDGDAAYVRQELKELEQLTELGFGAYVIKNYGATTVDGKAALVVENVRGAVSSKTITEPPPPFVPSESSISRLNEKSIADLKAIRDKLNKGVTIHDLQFLIGEDGSFKIHDSMGVEVGKIDKGNLKLIDNLIHFAEINIAKKNGQPQNVPTQGTVVGIAPLTSTEVNSVLATARQYWLNAGAPASVLDSAAIDIATLVPGLAGVAVGKKITLSTDGAGWGWFVDPSPTTQGEFTVMSQPNEFNAQTGGAAEGKLDLLTVVIHELGHVLGLGSIASDDDIMSRYLSPGVRRLPSADDIGRLQAVLSQQQDGTSATATSGGGQTLVIPAPTGNVKSANIWHGVPVISTLTNGDFSAGATGWQIGGNTTIDGKGDLILGESPNADAHLSQGFMINGGDRYLAFTVTDDKLQDNGGAGPNDAFEVALLNANTGEAIIGSDGLTRSDALLNIQTDGTEHAASSVHKVANPDGTATYYIDLQQGVGSASGNVLTGTPALLSFDLIGFGGERSTVSLRDIKLIRDPVALDDDVTADEDTAITIAPLANDLVGGATPVLELLTNPTQGSLTQNPDGSFSYQPAANYNGADSFSYRYTVDGQASNIATVHLTVRPVNDAPTAPGHSGTIMAGKPFTFDPLAGAFDVEGSPLTAIILAAPAHGSIVQNADGSTTYTADLSYAGTDLLTYQISDGETVSAPVTLQLTVLPANTAPVAHDAVVQVQEDGSLILDFAAFGADAENDTLTATITAQPLHGTLNQLPDGTWTYTPDANFFGSDELRFTLSDGRLVSSEAVLSMTINAVNDAPTVADQAVTLTEDGSTTLDPLASAVDIDGDPLTVAIVAGPSHGTLTVNADGSFGYRPDADYFGSDSYTYRINDGQLDSNIATVNLTIVPVNDAPVASDGSATLDEDGSLNLDLRSLGLDIDSSTIDAQIISGPAHGTLTRNADGSYTYTPEANYHGTDILRFTLSDGELASNEATVTLAITAVNDAPTLTDQAVTLAEDGSATLDLLASAIDIDGDPLTATIIAGPSHGMLTVNADGSFSYRPDADYFGSDSYTWRVNDGQSDSNVATVNLSITAVNDAPVARDGSATLDEDGSIVLDPRSLGLDIDSTTLDSVIVNGPTHGILTRNADGSYIYRPEANYNGSDTIQFQLSDGELISNLATLHIIVAPVNDAPLLADQAMILAEDGSATLDPLANATDIDGDPLTAAIVAGPSHGTLTVNADGSFRYRPEADYFGSDSYTYRINDGQLDSNVATVNLTITPVNDAPVASDGTATLEEDGSIVLDLRSLGLDIDSPTLDTVIVSSPSHGSLTRNPDGSYTYQPDANFNGNDAIQFQLNDGALSSNVATLHLTITAVNDAPTLTDQTMQLAEDGSVTLQPLATATDIDGDPLSAAIVAGPRHGALTMNADGGFSYRPDADYFGSDSYTWRVNDGQADSNIATVNLTITAVNDAPVARDGTATLEEDGSIVLDLRSLGIDIDSTTLDTVIVSSPSHGSLTRNPDGSYTYQPEANYNGSDTIQFELSDGVLNSNLATLTLNITAVNDAPEASDALVTGTEDAPLILRWSDFAITDIDHDALRILLTELPADGMLQKQVNGQWQSATVGDRYTQSDLDAGMLRFIPAANASGGSGDTQPGYGNQRQHYARFSYEVSDGQLTGNATISIDITPVADAPSLQLLSDTVTRQVFNTGWESAANRDSQSTLVSGCVFDGWTLVTRTDQHGEGQGLGGGKDGFEIWSNGDQMADAAGKLRSVYAAPGNGNNWLEINDAGGSQHQTLGISRQINTDKGARYALSFDLAGRLGYDSDTTRIGIYVDGVRVALYDNTSTSNALNWQHATVSFTGSGGQQTIRIVTEASERYKGGRGMMLDNLALDETVPLNQGRQGGSAVLQGIQTALLDTDGSETLQLTLAGLPIGSVLSDGVRSVTTSTAEPVADITGWNTAALSLTPPAGYHGTLDLQATATATESANGNKASVTQAISVKIDAVAQVPILTLTPNNASLSRKLIDTSWESVCGKGDDDREHHSGSGATLIHSDRFAGWHGLPARCDKDSVFQIWSSGDQMHNAAGKKVTVQAASGAGQEWLGLTNGVNTGSNSKYQSPGIERDIDTIDGAHYTFSLNYAAALGLTNTNTKIGVYLDSQLIGSYANTSPNSSLDWKALSFSFNGDGQSHSLRVELEGGTDTSTARGAMLDALKLIETLPNSADTVYGLENTAIALPKISAHVAEGDTGATLKTELSGMPKGATLSDGTRKLKVAGSNNGIDLAGWNLDKLTLTPPSGFDGAIKLQVRATSTETENGSTATITRKLSVQVLEGRACTTPVGVNPYVSYVNSTAVTTMTLGNTNLVVSPLVPVKNSCGIVVPRAKAVVQDDEQDDSDESMDQWLQNLSNTIGNALMSEVEKVLRKGK